MARPRYFASEVAPPSSGLSSRERFSIFSPRWRLPCQTRTWHAEGKSTSSLPSGAMVASSAALLWHDSSSMSWKLTFGGKSASHTPGTWCAAGGPGFHARQRPGKKGACLLTSLYLFSMFMFLAVVDWCCLVALYDVYCLGFTTIDWIQFDSSICQFYKERVCEPWFCGQAAAVVDPSKAKPY